MAHKFLRCTALFYLDFCNTPKWLRIIPFLFSRKTKPSNRKYLNFVQDWNNVIQLKGTYSLNKLVVFLYTLQILILTKVHLNLLL